MAGKAGTWDEPSASRSPDWREDTASITGRAVVRIEIRIFMQTSVEFWGDAKRSVSLLPSTSQRGKNVLSAEDMIRFLRV